MVLKDLFEHKITEYKDILEQVSKNGIGKEGNLKGFPKGEFKLLMFLVELNSKKEVTCTDRKKPLLVKGLESVAKLISAARRSVKK